MRPLSIVAAMSYDRVQRVTAFLLALCVLCAGQPFAAPASKNNQQAAAEHPAKPLTGADDVLSHLPIVKAYQRDFAQLPERGAIPIGRAAQRWVAHAQGDGVTVCAAHWLQAPAHDPPKTIRFCTLLN